MKLVYGEINEVINYFSINMNYLRVETQLYIILCGEPVWHFDLV